MEIESKRLVKKKNVGQRQWDTERNFNSLSLSVYHTNEFILWLSMVMAAFLGQLLCLQSFRQLGGRSKLIPEPLGPWFSARNSVRAKGGKFCSPTVLPSKFFKRHFIVQKSTDCFISPSQFLSSDNKVMSVTHFRKHWCKQALKVRSTGHRQSSI